MHDYKQFVNTCKLILTMEYMTVFCREASFSYFSMKSPALPPSGTQQ